jgi:preprotein translocase subunit YajC
VFRRADYNQGLTICDYAAYFRLANSFVFLVFWSFPVFISSAFAQTAPAAAAGGDMQSSMMSMLPLVLMFVVLYFVMIRPQMKKQKEHKAMIDAIAKGDEVVTAGGVLGKVSKIGDSYVGLEVANGVEIQIQRSAVVQVLPKGTYK